MGNFLKNKVFILLIFSVFLGSVGFSKSVMANSEILLTDLDPSSTSYYFEENKWGSTSNFADAFGNIVGNGIGLYNNGGAASHATYNIDGMGYKSFQATLTLDSKWLTGDFGKMAIGIYADDILLYEKQMPKDKVLPINLKLPENTKELQFVGKQIQGAKGEQRLVIANGKLSTSGDFLKASKSTTSLMTIGSQEDSYYFSSGNWRSTQAYQDIKGNIIPYGIGLYNRGGGRGYASFNIDQLGFNILETKITLDSKWTVGDFGKTAVGIYADDILIYEKQLTAKTAVQTVKVNIPKDTKNIKLVTQQIQGARGEQGVVFIDPIVKKTTDPIKKVNKTVSVNTVGAIDSSYYFYKDTFSSSSFQDVNGNIVTSGIALSTSGGGEGYAVYDIQNMGFNAFKAKISLDSKYILGNYGKSSIYIYGDNKLLYSKALSKSKGIANVTVRFPSKTKNVKILVKQESGAKGTHNVTLANAVFTKMSVTTKLKASQVKVLNHAKKQDEVKVTSLKKGDYIKVYSAKGSLLATSKKVTKTSITVNVKQLGKKKGNIYVTKISSGMLESDKQKVSYKAESK